MSSYIYSIYNNVGIIYKEMKAFLFNKYINISEIFYI